MSISKYQKLQLEKMQKHNAEIRRKQFRKELATFLEEMLADPGEFGVDSSVLRRVLRYAKENQ